MTLPTEELTLPGIDDYVAELTDAHRHFPLDEWARSCRTVHPDPSDETEHPTLF